MSVRLYRATKRLVANILGGIVQYHRRKETNFGSVIDSWLLSYRVFRSRLHSNVGRLLGAYGLYAASHPYWLIGISVLVFLALTYPLAGYGPLNLTDYPPLEFDESQWSALPMLPAWFSGLSSSAAMLLPVAITLNVDPPIMASSGWPPIGSRACQRDVFKTVASASHRLVDLLHHKESSFAQICYHVPKLHFGKTLLPNLPGHGDCLVVSPATLNAASDMLDVDSSDVKKDIAFGLPYHSTGLPTSVTNDNLPSCVGPNGLEIRFVVILFYNATQRERSLRHISGLPASKPALVQALSGASPLTAGPPPQENSVKTEELQQPIIYLYFRSLNWLEFLPMFIIYVVLLPAYIYFSVSKFAMVKSKAGLAVGAVFCILASFCVTLGICTRLGLASGFFFTATDVFPYAVVLNGLENVVWLTTAVSKCRRQYGARLTVPQCISRGLETEGCQMLRHICTIAGVSLLGIATGLPLVRGFFLMVLIGICADVFFLLVFFTGILALDIKRLEVDALSGSLRSLNDRDDNGAALINNGLIRRRTQRIVPAAVIDFDSGISHAQTNFLSTPIDIHKSEGIDDGDLLRDRALSGGDDSKHIILPLIRSRRFSFLFSAFCVLFITLLYLTSYSGGRYYDMAIAPVARYLRWWTVSASESSTIPAKALPFAWSLRTPASSWLRQLQQTHFQTLFSFYDVSLTSRYLAILQPIELHAHVPLESGDALNGGDLAGHTQSFDGLSGNLVDSSGVSITGNATKMPVSSESLSAHFIVVILVVLSMSVIINLSVLIYTCVRPRRRHQRVGLPVSSLASSTTTPVVRTNPSKAFSVQELGSHRRIISGLIRGGRNGRVISVGADATVSLWNADEPSQTAASSCQRPGSARNCWKLVASRKIVAILTSAQNDQRRQFIEIFKFSDDNSDSIVFHSTYDPNWTSSRVSQLEIVDIPGTNFSILSIALASSHVEFVQVNSNDSQLCLIDRLVVSSQLPLLATTLTTVAIGADSAIVFSKPKFSNDATVTMAMLPVKLDHLAVPLVHLALHYRDGAVTYCAVASTTGRVCIYELALEDDANGRNNQLLVYMRDPPARQQEASQLNILKLVLSDKLLLFADATGTIHVVLVWRPPHLISPVYVGAIQLGNIIDTSIDMLTLDNECFVTQSSLSDPSTSALVVWRISNDSSSVVRLLNISSPLPSLPVEHAVVATTSDDFRGGKLAHIVMAARNRLVRVTISLDLVSPYDSFT